MIQPQAFEASDFRVSIVSPHVSRQSIPPVILAEVDPILEPDASGGCDDEIGGLLA